MKKKKGKNTEIARLLTRIIFMIGYSIFLFVLALALGLITITWRG